MTLPYVGGNDLNQPNIVVNFAFGGGSGTASDPYRTEVGMCCGATTATVPTHAIYIGANKAGNIVGLSLDSNGNLNVNIAGTGTGGNAAASATGSAVPASADYGGINIGGTLRGRTGVNPSGSIFAASTDLSSIVGTTIDVNSGTVSAGTIRVVIATDQPALTNPQPVKVTASSTGGATPYTLEASTASNNATTVNAAASTLYGFQAFNLAAYPVFVKFYNKASTPTPGSDTAVKSIMIPANTTPANGAGVVSNWLTGVAFSTGLSYAIVKGQASSDNTAVAAGDCTLNLDWK